MTLVPWNPHPNNTVRVITIRGNVVYLGGDFTQVKGYPRKSIAAVPFNISNPTAWNPNVSGFAYPNYGQVHAIQVSNGKVYAGGFFTTLGTNPRSGLAIIDSATGIATIPNPAIGGNTKTVYTLSLSNDKLFVGGDFLLINCISSEAIAALDITTGKAKPINIIFSNGYEGKSLVMDSSKLLAAGSFSAVVNGSYFNTGLLAIDTATLSLASTNTNNLPNLTSVSVSPVTNSVYIGGTFNYINGTLRNYIAALDRQTYSLLPWNPGIVATYPSSAYFNPPVTSLQRVGNTLYVDGWFSQLSNYPRNRIGAFDISTTAVNVKPFNPSFPLNANFLYQFTTHDSVAFYGVNYNAATNTYSQGISVLDTTQGNVLSVINAPGSFYAMKANQNNTVYVAQGYNLPPNGPTYEFAAYNIATGAPTAFNVRIMDPDPGYNGFAYALDVHNDTIYLAGDFRMLDSVTRPYFAVIIDSTNYYTPAITISAAFSPICPGYADTFFANATNAGTAPAYQWKNENTPIAGAINATYISTPLMGGDTITCTVTSSAPGMISATSNKIITDTAIYWTGAAGNALWNDPLNWNCGNIPTAFSNVIIPPNILITISTTNAAANNLTLGAGVVISFAAGGMPVLTVNGVFINNGTVNTSGGALVVVP